MPDSTQASPAKERPKPKQAEQEQEVGNEFTMAMDSLTTAGNTSLSKQLKSRGNHMITQTFPHSVALVLNEFK